MTVLKAGWHAQFDLRPDHGTKNKALPGRLLEPGFGFLDGWIVFQSGSESTFKGDGAGSVHKTDQQEKEQEEPHPTTKCPLLKACAPRKKETSFHRWPNFSGGLAMSAACVPLCFSLFTFLKSSASARVPHACASRARATLCR